MYTMTLDNALFEHITDAKGRERPALRGTVPQHVLRAMGLLTGETGGSEEDVRITQIPVQVMQGVRERCVYTADFATVEENTPFPPPFQLVTVPCRSATEGGLCVKMGVESRCSLFGASTFVETPKKERVELIVAPVFPGDTLSPALLDRIAKKREAYLQSQRQWEEAFAPVQFLMDATSRGMQFWIKSWFG